MEEVIAEALRAAHNQFAADGRLATDEQLDKYYATFRDRFGPDQLKDLEGPQLLDTMHLHGSQDSLVYWLEFKDDEELPAIFGSIAGGSALKFGIYKRKETGKWMTGIAKRQVEISTAEAVEIARRHRDQLLAAAQVLSELSDDASDENYAALQATLERIAPEVQDTAWGRKYLSLLFPEKIDDFQSPAYQRFQLVKLLQTPPEGTGRYCCSGRFVNARKHFGWRMNTLTGVLDKLFGKPYACWRIGTTGGDGGVDFWPEMREGNVVATGWKKLGDLSHLVGEGSCREQLKTLMEQYESYTPQVRGREASELNRFLNVAKTGDIVVACKGETARGIGRITGEYNYQPESPCPNQRRVEWLSTGEWKLAEGTRSTFRQLGRKRYNNLIEIERRLAGLADQPPVKETSGGKTPAALNARIEHIDRVLKRKKQVILYGPPGTGKTYWAMKAAQELASRSRFKQSFESLNIEQQKQVIGGEDAQVHICCFHPAYGYEDFIEGYRPAGGESQLTFELRPGVFKRICETARGAAHDYYLIIDEINRGDIPRIFGELLLVLEGDKRGLAVTLPVSGKPFQVPENVHLIGTMNTADRSIALLDAALRRRFGFIELMPEPERLGDIVLRGLPLRRWLASLNQRIRQHIGRDARNLQVGHAYLLKDRQPVRDFRAFSQILRDDIIPLLEEYCYEDFDTLLKVLGSGLIDSAGQKIQDGLFAIGNEDELVRALLQQTPDLAGSLEATSSETPSESDTQDDPDEDE